jgi:capsular exopolysaccharide synthesis family protein
MLGLGLAFLFEYLDNTIKIPDEVESYFKVPLLGVILDHTVKGRREGDNNSQAELITLEDPKSAVSESYRGIRTRILFSSPETQPKSILMVSTLEAEGKTISSANLAVIMARTGSRVLLLDCDMRKPRINGIFGYEKEKGVSNVLVGECSISEAVRETGIENLDLMTCGELPPNPSELLGSKKMQEMLTTLSNDYDRIIIDSPPVSAVTDAVVLSQIVDGVVVILQANKTERAVVQSALEQLQAVHAHVFGIILNRIDASLTKYYSMYSYYNKYYGEEDIPAKKRRRKYWQKKGKRRREDSGRKV